MTYSIRNNLLTSLLGTVFLVLSATSLIVYHDSQQEIRSLIDEHLAQSAQVLFTLVAHELREENEKYATKEDRFDELKDHLAFHKFNTLLAFQISVAGEFNFISRATPQEPLSDNSGGFSQITIDDETWRVFTLFDVNDQISIRVAEKESIRHILIRRITLHVLTPLMLCLPILAPLIYLLINHGFKPLKEIGDDIKQRDVSQLDPIKTKIIPHEIQPLINALNNLLVRLERALKYERDFTSDAAHELRTPLAGLKAQAQVACKTGNEETRKKALAQLLQGIDNATQIVEQLLTLARLDPDTGLDKFADINLHTVITEVVTDLKPHTDRKNIAINISVPDTAIIRGNHDALKIMVRNLLDNAIAQLAQDQNGKIVIVAERNAGNMILSIIDNGPGIPDSEKELVFNRFYRRNNNKPQGSGLGLSIVKRITELHNAGITLRNPDAGTGLHVSIVFPA
ncbi:MAG: hypothetical protein A2W28_04875 [Gammaproteobacteria bacterium RBG_16_51_14]|nr:MAG: hypothetical protein A2W28_04875 [Gammaproteobacteria bacterium RBG_16_51_14]